MKFLITGAKGQLGTEFVRVLEEKNQKFYAFGKEELDIGNLEKVLEVFKSLRPDVVINCAAYNLVDKAEEEREKAFRVNALGPRNLAFACKKYGVFLIHYSTDYVFNGKKEGLYTEEDEPDPLSEYAKSKYLGEVFVKEESEDHLIFRVSWVYGRGKQNFIYKLMQWVEKQEYLRISCDEFSVPTSTKTIVEVSLKALNSGLKGLYHLVNSGYGSRYEWAQEVLKIKKIKKFIYPVYQSEFNLPAKRPRFSAMSNEKLCKILGIKIRHWKEELESFLKTS